MAREPTALPKISRPRLFGVSPRVRLFQSLDERRRHPVIWIAGPPGAGKTTVVATWLEGREIPGIWYQVDSGDADPATFFYYLGIAATRAQSGRHRPLPLLTPEYLPDLEGFARRFFRELIRRLPEEAVLVLDNYQEVAAEAAFHQVIEAAASEVPEGFNLIAVSRSDPPPCLSRLMVAQGVGVIDWPELQLTLDETRQIVRSKLALDEDTLTRLHRNSNGWAAGVTLMVERLKRSGLAPEAIEAETREAVFNYFAGVIFEKTAPENRHVLICTAFLPQVTPTIAEKLTGNPGAGRLLEWLYKRHLFTDRRTGAEPIYQYHALFREFLLARAHDLYTAEGRAQLSADAAAMLEASGQIEDAIPLYRDAGKLDAVTVLALAHAPRLLAQGRWQTLREWIGALPREHVSSTPWLLYWLGTSLIPVDQAAARAELEAAYRGFEAQVNTGGQLHAAASIMETHYYEFRDFHGLDAWIVVMEHLLATRFVFPSAEAELRCYASLLLAIIYRRLDHPLLPRCLERVHDLLKTDIDTNRKVTAATWLLQYYNHANQVDSAQQLIESVSPLLRDPAVTPLTQFFWWARLAPYYLFQADGAKADHALDCAEALTCDLKSHAGQLLMNGFRITAALLRHDVLGAESFAAELLRIARPGQAFHDGLSSFARFQLAANRGEAEEMLAAIRLAGEAFERGGNAYIAVEFRLPLAYALIDRGFYAEAQRHIDETARQLAGTFLHRYSNGLPLLEAYCALRQGDSERCHRVLGEALPAAAGKAGGRFYTLFPGRMLPILCDEALRAGVAVGSAQQLIRQLGLQPVSRDVENWPWPIRIETLGKFTLYKDGKALSFAGKVQQKPLELLKTILALGAAEVDTGAVKELLWSDAQGDAAQNAFDITLHRLRKLLAHDAAIELQHGKLTLNPQLCWVDAVALERLSDEAAGCVDWRDVSERALRLYRGHFLAQDGEQTWLIEPRSRLRSKFLRLIGKAGARFEATGDWDGAILLYQRGLELDSLAEPLYRRLMVCHQQRGDRAEAINVYRRCRDSLSIVLGVRPSTETENLYHALRQG